MNYGIMLGENIDKELIHLGDTEVVKISLFPGISGLIFYISTLINYLLFMKLLNLGSPLFNKLMICY